MSVYQTADIKHIFLDSYDIDNEYKVETGTAYFFRGENTPDYPVEFVPATPDNRCSGCPFEKLHSCVRIDCSGNKYQGLIAVQLLEDGDEYKTAHAAIESPTTTENRNTDDAQMISDVPADPQDAKEIDLDLYSLTEQFKPQENVPYNIKHLRFIGARREIKFPVVFKRITEGELCVNCALYNTNCEGIECNAQDRLIAKEIGAANSSAAPIEPTKKKQKTEDAPAFTSERWTSESGIEYIYPATQREIEIFELSWDQFCRELATNTSKKILANSIKKLDKRIEDAPVNKEKTIERAAQLLRERGEELDRNPPPQKKRGRTKKQPAEQTPEEFPEPQAQEPIQEPQGLTKESQRRAAWEKALRELEQTARKADELAEQAKRNAREAAKQARAIKEEILEMVKLGPENYQTRPLLEIAESAAEL